MSNIQLTSSIVAKEAVATLENMCSFAGMVNRDWESVYTQNMATGYSPGSTINIKRPPRYTFRDGRVSAPQATVETSIPLVLAQGGCDLNFTSFERTLTLQKLEDKMMAAMASVANEIDRRGLQLARFAAFNTIGTPGTLPTTQALALAAVTDCNRRLDEMSAPRKDKGRNFVMNPALNGATIQGFAGLFNAQSSVSKQFGSGLMVDSLGLAYAVDQNVDTHVNGAQPVGGGTVNGAGQSGAAITVNGGTITGAITRGSKITFAGVFAVNPQSRTSTGVLAQFTVTADVAIAAVSIPISPALTPTGAFQNVTASPANAAVVTIFGTASGSFGTSVAFHKDAFTLAMVPMWAPPNGNGVISVAQEEYKGFRIKVTEGYDFVNDNSIMRLDVLFGWAATYPELAVIFAT